MVDPCPGANSGGYLFNFLSRNQAMDFKTGSPDYFIQPLVNQQEALKKFKSQKGFLQAARNILKTDCIYLPVYIFKIATEEKNHDAIWHTVCIDAIEGQFAFIETEKLKMQKENSLFTGGFLIAADEAKITARSEFRTHLQRFKPGVVIRDVVFEASTGYPYWIAYFESKKGFSFDVIDGCSGKHQGVKMQSLFSKLILQKAQILKSADIENQQVFG